MQCSLCKANGKSSSFIPPSSSETVDKCVTVEAIDVDLDRNEDGDEYDDDLGNIYVLAVAIHYAKLEKAGQGDSLSCVTDGENFIDLCEQSGVPSENITFFKNKGANRGNIQGAIKSIGSKMKPEDCLIFYFSGHGTEDAQNPDKTAMVLMKGDGTGQMEFWWAHEIAACFSSSLPSAGRLLFIADCCHSGSITNFEESVWGNIRAISMSGCTDEEESTDLGKGSLMTSCLFLAINKLQIRLGKEEQYSVGRLFNQMLHEGVNLDNEGCDQHFVLCNSRALADASYFEWPLRPETSYKPPLKRYQQALRLLQDGNLGAAAISGTSSLAVGLGTIGGLAGIRTGKRSVNVVES